MSRFYRHTDPTTGRVILTGKSGEGYWYAYRPSDYSLITGGFATRLEALQQANRLLDIQDNKETS